MSRTPYLLLLAFAASACVTQTEDPDPDPDPPQGVAPRAGLWGYQERTQVSSTCRTNVPGEGGMFQIDQSSTASFRVVPADGTAPFQCTLNGTAFSCPNRAAAVQDHRPAVDAVVTVQASASGTFSSDARASGRQEATVSCQGAACTALPGAMFPCNFAVNFVITAR